MPTLVVGMLLFPRLNMPTASRGAPYQPEAQARDNLLAHPRLRVGLVFGAEICGSVPSGPIDDLPPVADNNWSCPFYMGGIGQRGAPV